MMLLSSCLEAILDCYPQLQHALSSRGSPLYCCRRLKLHDLLCQLCSVLLLIQLLGLMKQGNNAWHDSVLCGTAAVTVAENPASTAEETAAVSHLRHTHLISTRRYALLAQSADVPDPDSLV